MFNGKGVWEEDHNIITKPSHYSFIDGYEVKDITKILLDKIEKSDMNIPLSAAGWLQQALQYQLRCYEKGKVEDLKKAHQVLGFALEDIENGDVKKI